MTRLADRKTRSAAETNARVQGRPLCITLMPHEMFIRQKGRRVAFAVPYLAIYQLGAKIYDAEKRATERAAKGASHRGN